MAFGILDSCIPLLQKNKQQTKIYFVCVRMKNTGTWLTTLLVFVAFSGLVVALSIHQRSSARLASYLFCDQKTNRGVLKKRLSKPPTNPTILITSLFHWRSFCSAQQPIPTTNSIFAIGTRTAFVHSLLHELALWYHHSPHPVSMIRQPRCAHPVECFPRFPMPRL